MENGKGALVCYFPQDKNPCIGVVNLTAFKPKNGIDRPSVGKECSITWSKKERPAVILEIEMADKVTLAKKALDQKVNDPSLYASYMIMGEQYWKALSMDVGQPVTDPAANHPMETEQRIEKEHPTMPEATGNGDIHMEAEEDAAKIRKIVKVRMLNNCFHYTCFLYLSISTFQVGYCRLYVFQKAIKTAKAEIMAEMELRLTKKGVKVSRKKRIKCFCGMMFQDVYYITQDIVRKELKRMEKNAAEKEPEKVHDIEMKHEMIFGMITALEQFQAGQEVGLYLY